jgi:SAM-dependent methyltransferase
MEIRMNDVKGVRPHSSEYFGAERDFFWNSDYLDLLRDRLDLTAVHRAADIGCGVGHWSKILSPRLAPGCELVGVDREPSYNALYLEHMSDCSPQITAVTGDACDLPLPDHSFDLATCQTLMLHLQAPQKALREMMRITKPGGLILCIEPNNLVARLPFNGLMGEADPETLILLSELEWRYVLGRARLGKGAEFVGEQLPGLFAQSGLESIQVWLCDKAVPSFPPYGSEAEAAGRQAMERWRAEESGPFDRNEARENVLAGGGSEVFFDKAWQLGLKCFGDMLDACRQGRWSAAGGGLFYIVGARKPLS